ncbi:MFS general substrate transporter, partial [Hortaea werneckii]
MEEEEAMNAQRHTEDEAIMDDLDISYGRDQNSSLNRRTVRKLDFILLPFLALLFLLNSLDKSNVGNAETAGFTRDAGMSAGDLNFSMAFFFAFFVALQPIGAALGRKYEAGFYPTTVSYLSLFYTRYEFAVRLGFFYGQSAMAGALGGVLSWAIFNRFPEPIKGPQPPPRDLAVQFQGSGSQWKAWEVLFLIEGCTTMVVAMIGFLWLPHSAETAWFLNARERQWAEKRIHLDLDESEPPDMRRTSKVGSDSGLVDDGHPPDDLSNFPDQDLDSSSGEAHDRLLDGRPTTGRRKASTMSTKSLTADSGLTRQDILSAFLNYKIWHLLICNILSAIPATAFGVFLPLVIKQLSPSLNFSPAQSNLLTAPPFLCGAVVLWLFMYWSDRSRQRIVPILYGLGLLLIGLTATILSGQERYTLRYLSLCVLLSGSFIASPLSVAWLTNNTPEPGKRAILLGINGWGNLAGVFSSLLFTPDQDESG